MSNTKFLVPILIGSTALLIGARMVSWETNHPPVGACIGECYQSYLAEQQVREAAEAVLLAQASPADLGKRLYTGCAACHGMSGEGGVGPKLQGQTQAAIFSMLTAYKNKETRGAQSILMWGQSEALSTADMDNLGAYIETM